MGIANEDWFVTVGGDGYETRVDPTNPNTVYSQWQYGGLVRHDRKSGEIVDIKPRAAIGEEPLRWNWDTPLILSPHDPKRLYFAANKLLRTDDRGNSWRTVSGDLTRRIDRNQLKVMGRVQSADAVAKNNSTSVYGNIVSLDESPLVEGLLYVGTDDGLVQVSEDAGKTWRKIESIPGVPEMTYVSCLTASVTEPDVVFAAFDNKKNGDFKPYLFRSSDRGRTWSPISSGIPDRDIVYAILQDHVNGKLLFAGTEFGVYFSIDSGASWIRLKAGLPTIAVRDMAIQRRESDLVLGTFGRGFYVLDDYSPLRTVSRESLEAGPVLFPIKTALQYVERSALGLKNGRGWQAASYFTAPNPTYGAVFTYFLPDAIRSRKEARREREKGPLKEGKDVPFPSWDDLRAEDTERDPEVLIVVRDAAGAVVRRVPAKRRWGLHRVAWDLRHPSTKPTRLKQPENPAPWDTGPVGPLALPGTYTAEVALRVDGKTTRLTEPQTFEVVSLKLATFGAEDQAAVLAFRHRAGRLQRALSGTARVLGEIQTRIDHLRKAHGETPRADAATQALIEATQAKLTAIQIVLQGDPTTRKRNEPTARALAPRIEDITGDQNYVTSAPTQTQREVLAATETAFAQVLADVRALLEHELADLEQRMEMAGAPWTPGRLPTWEPK